MRLLLAILHDNTLEGVVSGDVVGCRHGDRFPFCKKKLLAQTTGTEDAADKKKLHVVARAKRARRTCPYVGTLCSNQHISAIRDIQNKYSTPIESSPSGPFKYAINRNI